jgi:hypothetical protein
MSARAAIVSLPEVSQALSPGCEYAEGMVRLLAILLLASTLKADEQTQKMTARLTEEADAFRRLAPRMLGEETLHQRAQKPPARFHPRIGAAAIGPPPVAWQERTLVSEYGFTSFAGEEESLHELRQVVSVDGRRVGDAKKAQDALAKVISLKDDARKRELLREFEKHGLLGAVTDFGQLILLFTPRNVGRFEFSARGASTLGDAHALVFEYSQIDGPEELTLFEPNAHDQPKRIRARGEVWVRADNFLPLRITLTVSQGDGPTGLHEEAAVDYSMSNYGTLLPTATNHRELRGGKLVAENKFVYDGFHEFAASTELRFDNQK